MLVVDEAILCDNSAILFISLAGDPAPVANLVERLGTSFLTAPATTDTPVNATTTLQKRAIIATLHALVIRTKQAPPRPVGPPAAKPMPAHTPLSSVSRAMCRHLRGHMAALTAYVIDVGRQFNKCDAAGDDVYVGRISRVFDHFR